MSLVFQKLVSGYNFNEHHSSPHNLKHVVVWTEYENCCIEKVQKDDDLYMIVWDVESNHPKEVKYGNVYVKSFLNHECEVDATSDIISKYDQWLKDMSLKANQSYRSKVANDLLQMRFFEYKVILKHDYSISRMRKLYKNIGYTKYINVLKFLISNVRNYTKVTLQTKLKKYFLDYSITNPLSYREWHVLNQYIN